jgi:hypothetical protein
VISETAGKAPEGEADAEPHLVAVYSIQIGGVKLSFAGMEVEYTAV